MEQNTVVLGGGLSGLAAAWALARTGRTVVVIEPGDAPGGLAGSFHREGHWFPLGYHHVLEKDHTLLQFLDLIGARSRLQWRRVRMLFELQDRLYDLTSPRDALAFPMPWTDKARFATLMLRTFLKKNWADWEGHSARELIDAWGGPIVRQTLFEPLCRLKFDLPASEVSAAWLGARLHFREGSTPLGYIPGENWTKVLCDGVAALCQEAGVEVRLHTRAVRLEGAQGRIDSVVLHTGERLAADTFVSSVPPPVYRTLVPEDETPQLASIAYTALLSVVCSAPRVPMPPFYWLNLSSLSSTACAIFRLDALNPTIGDPREMCVNFVTHLPGREHPLFALPDEELLARYRLDFRRLFGADVTPSWMHVARVPMYSPIFNRAYRNPPLRSATWRNVYFAGNYRTFPSVASTGTALASGLEAAAGLLDDGRRERAHVRPAA